MGRAHEVRAAAMAKTAAMKSKLYSRYGKEIYIAAKSGVPDPEMNLALRSKEKRRKPLYDDDNDDNDDDDYDNKKRRKKISKEKRRKL